MIRARSLAVVLAAAACGKAAPPAPAEPASAWCEPAAEKSATPLRGPLTAPDPRVAATLTRKSYALDTDGIARALSAGDDPTAQLAALVAVSAQRCRSLLPRVEVMLEAPAPTAVEAAATLAELGAPAQRERGLAALHRALGDASWPEVQVTAAAYLARVPDEAAVPAIRAALRSSNEAVRLQAVVAMPAFAGLDRRAIGGAAFSRLAELDAVLRGPASTWLVRREAVYQVAKLDASAEQVSVLARVAREDGDERVRKAAALRLPPGGAGP